jgi:hypothetical protein
MQTISYDVRTCQTDSPLRLLLQQIDLADWEISYHASEVDSHLQATQHHLEQLYKVHRRRKRLRRQANSALATAPVEVS